MKPESKTHYKKLPETAKILADNAPYDSKKIQDVPIKRDICKIRCKRKIYPFFQTLKQYNDKCSNYVNLIKWYKTKCRYLMITTTSLQTESF